MSRKHGTLEFSGGMNNVVPPHLLKDNEAEEIRNLYLDTDGVWKDINDPEIMLDLSETHLHNAVRVVQWKPTKVPSDCIDDFVYVVFYTDGKIKMVYRGAEELAIYTVNIKARMTGTGTYLVVPITGLTLDIYDNSNGITPIAGQAELIRSYYINTQISMIAPEDAGEGTKFQRWIDGSTGETLFITRNITFNVSENIILIAEYEIIQAL